MPQHIHSQSGEQRERGGGRPDVSRKNLWTALVLAAIALLFYIGFILTTMWT